MKLRWPGFLVILALMVGWEFVTYMEWVDTVSVPRISIIFEAWWENIVSGALFIQLLPTLRRVFISFFLAVAVGVPVGLLMGSSRMVYRLLEPLTELLRPIPSSAYIPVAILFLGIGDQMKIFVVFLACIFPILLNTYSGVLSVDSVLVDTGRTLGISRAKTLWQIVFPASLPSILTGMRISLGISLIVVVVAEMITSNSGIGYYILDMQRAFHIPEMFVGIFTLGVVGYLLNTLFLQTENYLLRWRNVNATS
jgi:ABC-type nitrate/sulfonate/bicarbonate transport system permease component